MNWIDIENKLPEDNYDCFVLYPDGYGYGHYDFDYEYDYISKRFKKLKNKTWYLDFDASGHEKEITHWMKIELPI